MPANASVPCPDCGTLVFPDQQQLCPKCGYPLLLLRTDRPAEARAVPRAPGEFDDATALMTDTAAQSVTPDHRTRLHAAVEPSPDGRLGCWQCGYRNEPDRVRCEHCGYELRSARPAAVLLPPAEPAVVARPRARTWIAVLAVAAAVAAVIAVGAYLVFFRQAGTVSPQSSAPARLERVDPATITASASSTLPDSRFRIQNTLDGKASTVWNSDGKRLRSNVGVTLTYRFASPVTLARITIVNGSARSGSNFTENQRVAALRIRTDTGETTWNLTDSVHPQSITLPPAPTNAVTFEVTKVYPGTKYRDLAVTDVAFERAP